MRTECRGIRLRPRALKHRGYLPSIVLTIRLFDSQFTVVLNRKTLTAASTEVATELLREFGLHVLMYGVSEFSLTVSGRLLIIFSGEFEF